MAAVGGFKTWLNPKKPGGVQPRGAAGLIAGLLGASLIAGSISKRRKRKQRERYRRQYFREIAQGLIEMGAPVTNFQEDASWINKPHNPNHPITSVKDVYRTIDEKNHWRKQVKRVEDMKREKYIMTNQPTRLTKVSDRFLTKITKAERKKYKLTSGDPMDRAVKVYTQIISIIETEIAKEKAKNKISIADLGTQGGASPFYKTSITSTSPVYSA